MCYLTAFVLVCVDVICVAQERLGQEIYNANEAKCKRESRLRLQHTDSKQVNAAKREIMHTETVDVAFV